MRAQTGSRLRNWRWLVPLIILKWMVLASVVWAGEGIASEELQAQRELLRYLTARPVPSEPRGMASPPGASITHASLPGVETADWREQQPAFISPLDSCRPTSEFCVRRWHPILGGHRPHLGLDLAAPLGTPVKATAAGRVIFIGWDEGGGNVVKVEHDADYLTAYLHLSGFAQGLVVGQRVEQGEILGFVGSTGLATGPHLDYRIMYRGRWIDPRSVQRFDS